MSHDAKWKKAQGFHCSATTYITCQVEMHFGAAYNEAMDKCLQVPLEESSSCRTRSKQVAEETCHGLYCVGAQYRRRQPEQSGQYNAHKTLKRMQLKMSVIPMKTRP